MMRRNIVLFFGLSLISSLTAFQRHATTPIARSLLRVRSATNRVAKLVPVERAVVATIPTVGRAGPATPGTALFWSLPTCAAGNELRTMVASGIVCALSQSALGLALRRRSRGRGETTTTTTTADSSFHAYTAHSAVTLALMTVVSAIGVVGWWGSSSETAATAVDRLLRPSPEARWLSSIVAGAFLFWDVPTSARVEKLRKPDVVTHHVIMLFVALAATFRLPVRYALYYFGVVELSSVPLVMYDQVCHWNSATDDENNNDGSSSLLKRSEPILQALAVVAFTLVRVVSFPLVTVRRFLPDCLSVLSDNATTKTAALVASSLDPTQKRTVRALMFAVVGFMTLQLFWFSQILKVVVLGEGDNEDKIVPVNEI